MAIFPEATDVWYFWHSSPTYLEEGVITFFEIVYFCQSVQCHIPKESDLTHCCEHLEMSLYTPYFLTTSCLHFSVLYDNCLPTIKVSVLRAVTKTTGSVVYIWIVFIKFEYWLGHLLNFCVILWFSSIIWIFN